MATTTAIFAEILAIGIQATVLVGLALATFMDLGAVAASAGGWEAALTIVILALAYVIGVVVDRVADTVLTPLRNRVATHSAKERAAARLRVLRQESPLSTFLEYQRSRLRLMRGTIVNGAIAIPVVNGFLVSARVEADAIAIVAVNAVILVLIAACIFSFTEIVRAQDKWLNVVADADDSKQSK